MSILKRVSSFFRSIFSKPTIGPYDEVKKSIMEGKAVPYTSSAAAKWKPTHTWAEALQISEPMERYLKLGDITCMKGIREGYDALTDDEKVVFLVSGLEAEVNNGGFDQFFFNSVGNYALETLEILRMIGSLEATELLENAIRVVFGEEMPNSDREERWEELEQLSEEQKEKLNEIDNKFFSLKEPLFELVVNYIDRGEQ